MAFSVTWNYQVIDQFSPALTKFANLAKKANRATLALRGSTEKASRQFAFLRQKMFASGGAMDSAAQKSLANSQIFDSAFDKVATSAKKAATNINTMERESGELGRAMSKAAQKAVKLNVAVTASASALSKMRGAAQSARGGLNSIRDKTAGASAVMTGLGVVSIITANKFQTSINRVQAVTNSTNETMAKLEDQAKMLGSTTAFSASQAADAMTFLGQAGLNAEQIMQAMPGTLQLAAAGGLDLASAADIATNVLAQMGFSVSELGRVNDVLALGQTKVNANISELFEAMRPAAITAKGLGFSLEELTASLGTMANAGEKGSVAGTLMRAALLKLANPSKSAIKTFAKLGVNINEFRTPEGKIKNFTGFIDALNKSGITTTQTFQIFGERGARAIQILQSAGGESLRKLTKDLEGAGGAAARQAATMQKGLPGAINSASSALEGLILKLTSGEVGEFIQKMINGFTSIVRSITNANPGLLKFAAVAVGIVAVIAPLAGIMGVVALAVGAIATPVGIVVAAVIALGAAFGAVFAFLPEIKAEFPLVFALVSSVVEAISGVFAGLADTLKASSGLILSVVTAPLRAVEKLLEVGSSVGGFFSGLFGGDGPAPTPKGVGEVENQQRSKQAQQGMTMNGSISVSAAPGSQVNSTESSFTGAPGNLGLNLAGAPG